jgi:hypothetical protein
MGWTRSQGKESKSSTNDFAKVPPLVLVPPALSRVSEHRVLRRELRVAEQLRVGVPANEDERRRESMVSKGIRKRVRRGVIWRLVSRLASSPPAGTQMDREKRRGARRRSEKTACAEELMGRHLPPCAPSLPSLSSPVLSAQTPKTAVSSFHHTNLHTHLHQTSPTTLPLLIVALSLSPSLPPFPLSFPPAQSIPAQERPRLLTP